MLTRLRLLILELVLCVADSEFKFSPVSFRCLIENERSESLSKVFAQNFKMCNCMYFLRKYFSKVPFLIKSVLRCNYELF
nr:hypothetical protein KDAJHZZV_KDAJHZZV_CDS_0006 [Microvirus sp.]